MPENLPSVGVTRLISLAVNFAIVGLVYLLLFLWHGLGAWSMGLGMFVGMPLLLIALLGAPLLSAVASYLPTLTAVLQDPVVVLRDQ